MKKYSAKLVIWMIVSAFFALAFFYSRQARTRIHDIHALPLLISETNKNDFYINAIDADYNWFQDFMMFSVEMNRQTDEALHAEWTFINGEDVITIETNSTSSILTSKMNRSMLHAGTWQVFVSLKNNSGSLLELTNSNSTDYGIPVFTFICN